MLDTQTKKRIDDCRDILVGKLPDPKAQIEQITIGLIYKFMDDMDKEAIELGGHAKFFSNYVITDPKNPDKEIEVEFEKYSWDKLFESKVTASEMLKLYSEAIESMEKNPNIPQLFRDIFNNAYLPYRDPETLKLFLKTINEFEYTHSEKLGDAFEYLLSVMGSQGDAGQFRTPRHIIDFLVAIVDPQKTDTILDPACGTAGFLISAFKHIKQNACHAELVSASQKTLKQVQGDGDGLTPDEQKKLIQNFVGYDISPDMVRLSLVNLYLHGFSDPHIHEYDTLSSEERWNETYDVVLANPPFMSPKGGIRPHKKFTTKSNRSEVLFVDYIAEHLNPKGRAGVIVPEGVIFQSGTAYKELRKMLVENYLYAVVSLSAGVFNPYSGVKTSILLMDKELAKSSNEILFVKIDNDGYSLGAQRTAIKGGELDEAIQDLKKFKSGEFTDSSVAHVVLKSEIAKNGEYNLSGERYKANEILNSEFEWTTIGEVADLLTDGDWIESKDQSEEGIRLIQTGNIGFGEYKDKEDKARFITQETFERLKCTEVFPEDVLVSRLPDPVGRACFVPNLNSKLITAVDCSIIRFDKARLLPKLFVYYTKINGYYKNIEPCLTGSSRSRISRKNLASIQIPLPPLSVQEEIVAKIEGYQKIIDGAKMVVENYKPKIDIDPEWEMVELGEVCNIKSGGTPSRQIESYWNGNIPWVGSTVCKDTYVNSAEEFITEEGLNKSSAKLFDIGTTLIALVGATIGKTGFLNFECTTNQNIAGLFPKSEDFLDKKYLYFACQSIYDNFMRLGEGKFRMATLSFVREQKIPLPTIEVQQQIVSQIEKEQELVNANKQLIEIFEQKIKARIAKVWGSSTSLTTSEEKTEKEQELDIAAEPETEYKTN